MLRAPRVEPLDTLEQQIAVRRLVAEALIDCAWNIGWAGADRAAASLVDRLKAEDLEIVRVRWR